MNNINCEHCGSLIDTDKETKCPNCGAPYKNNKQYKEYQEYKKKQAKINLESQEIANKITKDAHEVGNKVIPGVFIFIIIIFLIAFSSFFFMFRFAFSSMDDYEQKRNDYIKNQEYIDFLEQDKDNIYIFFNEYAYTDQYDIKVDKVTKYTETKFDKNKQYYGFHIVFKNKTNTWKTLNDIKLTYKNEEEEERSLDKAIVSTKTLDYFASDDITYDGYLYYDIPDGVKDVTFKYENIYITIFDFKNKIK